MVNGTMSKESSSSSLLKGSFAPTISSSSIKTLSVQELEEHVQKLRESLNELTSELDQRRTQSENGTLDTSTPPTSISEAPPAIASKSGYLFKWQDRTIGWGGTKWNLRFVQLEHGNLSYFLDHSDPAPRYVLTLRRCTVRDDGFKINHRRNWKNESNAAHFHIFSVCPVPPPNENDTDNNTPNGSNDSIVPLLRFSTTSLTEKNQWMELIAESCAYCDSPQYVPPPDKKTAIPSTKKGTIPPVYFAPSKPMRKRQSLLYQTVNASPNANKSNSKRKADYPPSKPMHRYSGHSYLSYQHQLATKQPPNYRGLLNLGGIILAVSNFRLLLLTMREFGFVLASGSLEFGWSMLAGFFSPDAAAGTETGNGSFSLLEYCQQNPLAASAVIIYVTVTLTYCIETAISRRLLSEPLGVFLHVLNTNASLFVPMAIVWYAGGSESYNPIGGGIGLLASVVTWMKLISYVHANADYRRFPDRSSHTIGMIQGIDDNDVGKSYPDNITLSNLYYFWCAPTLTYQIAFPRIPRTNWMRVARLTGQLFLSTSTIVFLVAQVVSPNLEQMMKELADTDQDNGLFSINIIAEYLLKLAIASTYVWLLVFYSYFHVFFNLMAELLRFGDRVFYKDWWNSSEVSSYWRLWNLPVHYWLVRHLYFPCIRRGAPKAVAMFTVFLLSAVLHEVLISVPFHMIRPWSFLGMMGQIPLVIITKFFDKLYPGSSVGNLIFWLSFCIVGQPAAILMYTIDSWKMTTGAGDGGGQCPSSSSSCEL